MPPSNPSLSLHGRRARVGDRTSTRPNRSVVAPSATATSKSSLMPIDSSRRPELAGLAASQRKHFRAPLEVAGRTDRHQPADVEGQLPAVLDQGVDVLGTAPGLAGAPVTLTWTRTSDPGAGVRPPPRRPRRRSMPCQVRTRGASRLTLFRWTGPRKCHRHRRGTASRLGQQLLGVVLADVGKPGGHGSLHRVGAEALGDRDDPDRVGIATGLVTTRRRTSCQAATPPSRRQPPVITPPHHRRLAPSGPGPTARTNGRPSSWCRRRLADQGRPGGVQRGPHPGRQVEGGLRRSRSDARTCGPEPGRPCRRGPPPRRCSSRVDARARATASTRVAPSRRMVWTVASTTPARRPRQPAWATPSTPSRAGQGDRGAVGGQDGQGRSGHGGHGRVGRLAARGPGPLDHDDPGAVHLVEHRPGQVDDGPAPALDRRRHPRPGRPGPSRCCALGLPPASSQSAGYGADPGWSSLLEEVGDVELVADEAEVIFVAELPFRLEQADPAEPGRRSRARGWSSQRSKPAAMTVTRTSSPIASSMTCRR